MAEDTRSTIDREAAIQVVMHALAPNGPGIEMRKQFAEAIRAIPTSVRTKESYAEWQQKRGMLADTIDWAIAEYDNYMLDDRYDAQAVLDRIVARLRERRDMLKAGEPKPPGPPDPPRIPPARVA